MIDFTKGTFSDNFDLFIVIFLYYIWYTSHNIFTCFCLRFKGLSFSILEIEKYKFTSNWKKQMKKLWYTIIYLCWEESMRNLPTMEYQSNIYCHILIINFITIRDLFPMLTIALSLSTYSDRYLFLLRCRALCGRVCCTSTLQIYHEILLLTKLLLIIE